MTFAIYKIPTITALGMDSIMGITPAATFIENRLRLGHPSKLMVLSLYFFCACSATIVRWVFT